MVEVIKIVKYLWCELCLWIFFVGGNKFFILCYFIGVGVFKVYYWDLLKDRLRCDYMVDIKIDIYVVERFCVLKIWKRRKIIFWWKFKFKRFDL